MQIEVSEGPLGEYTGYYTPASPKPIARVKAITHRNGAYYQGLLTGVPPTENHILKQLPFEASFLAMMRKPFPTIERVANSSLAMTRASAHRTINFSRLNTLPACSFAGILTDASA